MARRQLHSTLSRARDDRPARHRPEPTARLMHAASSVTRVTYGSGSVAAGYPVLEALPAWSGTEKLRVRLAASLVEGDLGQAARLLGDRDWRALLVALAVAYEG